VRKELHNQRGVFYLGFASIGVGYFVLLSTPAKIKQTALATNSHIALGQLNRPATEIKRNLLQKPVTPQSPIAKNKPLNTIRNITIILFIVSSSGIIIRRMLRRCQPRFIRTHWLLKRIS